MKWNPAEGNWKQLKGNREMVSGKLQDLYGISKEKTEKRYTKS